MIQYRKNPNTKILLNGKELISINEVLRAVKQTNDIAAQYVKNVVSPSQLDFHDFQGKMGTFFCEQLQDVTKNRVMVNPYGSGYPDLCITNTEEKKRYFKKNVMTTIIKNSNFKKVTPINANVFQGYMYGGIEVKATMGLLSSYLIDDKLTWGEPRINYVSDITAPAHHQETNEMFLLHWDFINGFPTIAGVFYSNNLTKSDWSEITEGHGRSKGTRYSSLTKNGRNKLKDGWLLIINDDKYINKFTKKGCNIDVNIDTNNLMKHVTSFDKNKNDALSKAIFNKMIEESEYDFDTIFTMVKHIFKVDSFDSKKWDKIYCKIIKKHPEYEKELRKGRKYINESKEYEKYLKSVFKSNVYDILVDELGGWKVVLNKFIKSISEH